MIRKLTPKYEVVCDRCGKSWQTDPNGEIKPGVAFFNGLSCVEFAQNGLDAIKGEVCDECFKDFCDLAELFFDDVNKGGE